MSNCNQHKNDVKIYTENMNLDGFVFLRYDIIDQTSKTMYGYKLFASRPMDNIS